MATKTYEIIDGVEKLTEAIARVRKAQQVFATYTQEQVDKIFLAAASAANKARIPLAKMAVEETGMGIVEDTHRQRRNHIRKHFIKWMGPFWLLGPKIPKSILRHIF